MGADPGGDLATLIFRPLFNFDADKLDAVLLLLRDADVWLELSLVLFREDLLVAPDSSGDALQSRKTSPSSASTFPSSEDIQTGDLSRYICDPAERGPWTRAPPGSEVLAVKCSNREENKTDEHRPFSFFSQPSGVTRALRRIDTRPPGTLITLD